MRKILTSLSWITLPPARPIEGAGKLWFSAPVATGAWTVIRGRAMDSLVRKTKPWSCHYQLKPQTQFFPNYPLIIFHENTLVLCEGIKKEKGPGPSAGPQRHEAHGFCLNPASSVDSLFHERQIRKTLPNSVEKETSKETCLLCKIMDRKKNSSQNSKHQACTTCKCWVQIYIIHVGWNPKLKN